MRPPDYPALAAIRLGFGLSPRMAPPADLAGVLAGVADAARPDGWTRAEATAAIIRLDDARKARDAGTLDPAGYKALADAIDQQRLVVLQRRIARALDAPSGFGERLVQFWADHFTTVPQNPPQHLLSAALVDEAIRPNLGGRLGDMVVAAVTHPMMLVYLNQTSSVGPNSRAAIRRSRELLGLNENLAREVLELHTLGVGAPYGQGDVRALAELFTGLSFNPRNPVHYRPQMAEPGAETVLGRRYGGDDRDGLAEIARALGDLAAAPATAAHLARKLAIHFAADDPPAGLVEDLAATLRGSGGDLAQVNAVLAGHPDLSATFRAKARQPFDFVVAGLRALGVTGAAVLALAPPDANRLLWAPLARMGQPFVRARGPDGWPEAAADWITPQTLAARIDWALRVPARFVDPLPDPRALIDTALGGSASEALATAVPRAETVREGVALVLASTDFNRR